MEHERAGIPAFDLIEVREGLPEDAEPASALLERVANERRWIATEPPVDRAAWEREWEDGLGGLGGSFVAVAADELVGFLTLQRGEAHVVALGMIVASSWRRRGVGSRLIESALAWANARPEIGRVDLAVFPHNRGALALYRKFGFIEHAVERAALPRRNGQAWDVIVMRRPIAR